MSLLLIDAPDTIAFAKNPIVFQIRADQDGAGTLYDATGVHSTLTGAFTGRFLTNETVTLTYEEPDGTSEAVIFTAKAVYDDANEIPDNSYAGSDTAYWVLVRDTIAKHPRIAPFFMVSSAIAGSDYVITIRARSTDSGWALALTTSSGFAVSDNAGTASALPANYKVLFEVFVERTYQQGDFTLSAQLQGTPAAGTGYVYFDISSIMAAECRAARSEPLVPEWNTVTPALADTLRRYYVRFTEESGEPPVAEEWQYSSNVVAVMDAGVSQSVFAEGSFLSALDDTDALLTWMPDGRKLGLSQPEFLAWYNHSGGTKSVYIEMQWYDIDTGVASASQVFFDGTPLSVRDGEVALLPVNPTLLGLDVEPDAYKFRVRVVYDLFGNEEELSQWRTYYIDRDYYESERYIQYLNGFGVPECWRCTGQWTKKLKVDRQTAVKPLAPGYNTFASDRYQFARLWDNELIYRTGFLTAGEAEVLQEMLIAGELYDVSSEGYIPLQITTGDFTVVETRENLRAYQFSAQPRLDMKNYSKKKLSSLLAGAWQEPGGAAWFDAFLVAWGLP